MSVIGIASVSPALPGIAEQFSVEAKDFGLILSVFAIPGIVLTPILGIISDRYGRRIVIVPTLLLFGVAGFMCALTDSFEMLLVFRFLQGVGAAALGALNVALIGDLFEGADRPRVMGINHSVLSIGTALFPVIGGVLASASYKYVFYMPLLAIPIAVYVFFFLDVDVKGQESHIKKYLGNFVRLLKNRNLISLLIVSVSIFVILMGPFLTYVPYIAGEKFKINPTMIGLILASMSATTSLVGYFLDKFLKRFTHERLLKFGLIGYAVSMGLVPFYSDWYMLFLTTIIFGASLSFVLPNSQSMIIKFSDENNRALLMSFNRMISQVGQAFGPILSGVVLTVFSDSIGISSIYYVTVAFIILILIIFSLLYSKQEGFAK
jgi:MFS family permease